MSALLAVFLKWPQPGFVKTRLAAAIGAENAAALSRAMAERVLERTRPEGEDYRRVIFYAPPEAHEAVARWQPGEPLRAQVPGDLGARMAAAFAAAFDEGADRVVLIGTDTPDLSRDDVRAALSALGSSDVALGPSLDGGYYLIALSRPHPALFSDIPWSTPAVLDRTLARAEELDLKVAPLSVRGDVDTGGDLRRDWGRLRLWLPSDLAEVLRPTVGENDGA